MEPKVEIFLIQGVLLILTAFFIKFTSGALITKRRTNIDLRWVIGTYLGVVTFLWLAQAINLPHLLHPLEESILKERLANRDMCMQSSHIYDWTKAYKALRDTKSSKVAFRAFNEARTSLDVAFLPLMEPIIFGLGTTLSIVPFIVLLGIAFFYKTYTGGKLSKIFPLQLRSYTFPAMYSSIMASLAVFFVFHFIIEGRRRSLCLLISGHWFTYAMTTLIFALFLVHILQAENWRIGTVSQMYLGYFAAYQAITLLILQFTQRFFHHDDEAIHALNEAIHWSPLVVLTYIGVELFNRRQFSLEMEEFNKRQTLIQQISSEDQAILKEAGISSNQLLDPLFVSQLRQEMAVVSPVSSPPTSPVPPHIDPSSLPMPSDDMLASVAPKKLSEPVANASPVVTMKPPTENLTDLLASIRQFNGGLKHVDKGQVAEEKKKAIQTSVENPLLAAVMKKMEQRRSFLQPEPEFDDSIEEAW